MTILEEINETKKEEVKKLRQTHSLSRFKDSEFFEIPKISLYSKLNIDNRISVIAEIKRASPSKGIIRENFNHLEIAEIYMNSGADAISILTDENYFKGSIKFLHDIAKIKTVPLLRKDFIIDEFQIFDAKANGADAILLIAESLSKNQIQELTEAAAEVDLEVLLELHSVGEIKKIDFNQNKIVGINNRDLRSFEVDLSTTKEISELIPSTNLVVAESGIKSRDDLEYIKKTKAKSILVGEQLMKSQIINEALKELIDWCYYEG
ncbi:MAG: indole-3-glycerol phosphate synthase TrpC [Melioribacteraceae bacterium]|nr:indole-3-glycerol phosphate synthase TrpC [Melioribacteraceae bacterium]